MTTERAKQKNLSLEEFVATAMPGAWADLQKHEGPIFKNCQSWSDCHVRMREETGLWIEELVPVFHKLDATLVQRD
jgi:hypothetical protein